MLIDMGRLGQRSKWPTATYHDAYDSGPVARTWHLRKEKAEKEAKRMTTKSQSISFFSPFSLQEQSRVLACTVGLLLLGEMHAQCFESKDSENNVLVQGEESGKEKANRPTSVCTLSLYSKKAPSSLVKNAVSKPWVSCCSRRHFHMKENRRLVR